MEQLTIVTGNIATYHLTPEALSALIDFLPNSVDHAKISDKVYHVTSLEAVDNVYRNNLVFPDEGNNVSEICFFDGDSFPQMADEKDLAESHNYSYSLIAPNTYKRVEL